MAVKRLTVTIDRVQLSGVSRADAPVLVASLRTALESALRGGVHGGATWNPTALAELRPAPVRATGGPRPIGRALGRAMAAEMTKGAAST